ncbi:hypothetical protein [Scrofimicrobium sp. R131]|uniref:Uncharacterized protein n=1 Tax=Scrofimicrobium appendicitidis TaxID=3079930 RepID=A0AAU7V871_9ACTO
MTESERGALALAEGDIDLSKATICRSAAREPMATLDPIMTFRESGIEVCFYLGFSVVLVRESLGFYGLGA